MTSRKRKVARAAFWRREGASARYAGGYAGCLLVILLFFPQVKGYPHYRLDFGGRKWRPRSIVEKLNVRMILDTSVEMMIRSDDLLEILRHTGMLAHQMELQEQGAFRPNRAGFGRPFPRD